MTINGQPVKDGMQKFLEITGGVPIINTRAAAWDKKLMETMRNMMNQQPQPGQPELPPTGIPSLPSQPQAPNPLPDPNPMAAPVNVASVDSFSSAVQDAVGKLGLNMKDALASAPSPDLVAGTNLASPMSPAPAPAPKTDRKNTDTLSA
jgi:hypothetical protein